MHLRGALSSIEALVVLSLTIFRNPRGFFLRALQYRSHVTSLFHASMIHNTRSAKVRQGRHSAHRPCASQGTRAIRLSPADFLGVQFLRLLNDFPQSVDGAGVVASVAPTLDESAADTDEPFHADALPTNADSGSVSDT